jgi:hypothetical protein
MSDITTHCQSLGDQTVGNFSSCNICLEEKCFWCKEQDGSNIKNIFIFNLNIKID